MAKSSAQLDREIAATLQSGTLKKDEVIATRKTADDKAVALWSDGSLTWSRIGRTIQGSPHARTAAQVREALAAGWLVMGEVELYDADEVPRLIKVARKVARKGGDPGDVRSAFGKDAPLKPHWTTLEADRNGKPLVRVWRLPRMSHPGMAVWDTLRNASRGRYEVMTEVRAGGIGRRSERNSGTYATTGVRFHDLGKLSQYLRETSQLR